MIQALYIEPERRITFEVDADDLTALQGLVGGYIESIRLHDGGVMLVDEDGLMKNLPLNPFASVIAGRKIVGNAIIVGQKGANFTDAPQDYLNLVQSDG